MTTPNVMRPPQFSLDQFLAWIPIYHGGFMVEVGSYQGESTEAFAKSGKFAVIYAVDPWSNEIYDPNDKATLHCDMAVVEEAFDARCGKYHCIRKWKLNSATASTRIPNASLDLVYLDGNHTYDAVKQDIALWLPKLKSGGILSGHDYGTHPGVKKAVDEAFGKPKHVFKDYSWVV